MTLLITGATGLLGNNVVRVGLERGLEMRCLVREGSDPRPLAGLDVETVEGDLRDPLAVARAVSGCAGVIHAGGRVGVGRRNAEEFRAVNVDGTRHVVAACREAGARLVHVSSVDALPFGTRDDPTDEEDAASGRPPPFAANVPYMATKRAAEAVVLDAAGEELDARVVNPAYLLGPWDWKPSSGRMLLAVAGGGGRVAPPGGNDFCHVGDVAEAVLEAYERGSPGRRYILSGEALTYREAFALFAEVTGGPPPRLTAPAWAVRAAGRIGDLVGRLRDGELDLNSATAEAAVRPHHFDDARARRELGYAPRNARQAAEDAWRWFVDHGYATPRRSERAF